MAQKASKSSVYTASSRAFARIKPLPAALSVARAAAADTTKQARIKLLARLRSAAARKAALAKEAKERIVKRQLLGKRAAARSMQSATSSRMRVKPRKHAATLQQGGLAALVRAYKERKVTPTAAPNATPKTDAKGRRVPAAAARAAANVPVSAHKPRSWLRRKARKKVLTKRGARGTMASAAKARRRLHRGASLWKRLQGKTWSESKKVRRAVAASTRPQKKPRKLSMRRSKPKSRKARRAQSHVRRLLSSRAKGKRGSPAKPSSSTASGAKKKSEKQATSKKDAQKQTKMPPLSVKHSTKMPPLSVIQRLSEAQKQAKTPPPSVKHSSVKQNARKPSAPKFPFAGASLTRAQATHAGPPAMRHTPAAAPTGAHASAHAHAAPAEKRGQNVWGKAQNVKRAWKKKL